MNSQKVSGVVVTFNRKKLLLECLHSLKNQTYPPDAIFVIDNASTDGTPEALLEEGYITKLPKLTNNKPWETVNNLKVSISGKQIKLYYVRLPINNGCSGGFYEGIKRAYEKGYDWIWLMDDDAEPKRDALEKMMKYRHLSDVVALAPVVKNPDGQISKPHRGHISFRNIFPMIQAPLEEEEYKGVEPIQIDFVSFVGPLIKRSAVERIGYPKKEFFLHHDDVEYSIRLSSIGKIYLIPDSVILHKEHAKSTVTKKNFFGRQIHEIKYDKLWRYYYGTRNLTYLGKLYSTNKLRFVIGMVERWALSVGRTLLFDDHKIKRIQFITSAYLDGIRGIFDNEKPRGFYMEKLRNEINIIVRLSSEGIQCRDSDGEKICQRLILSIHVSQS